MANHSEASFEIKADFLPLTVLKLKNLTVDFFKRQLVETVKKAPQFFHQAPIVLDVNDANPVNADDIANLCDLLRSHQMIPVGIRGQHIEKESVYTQGLAVFKSNEEIKTQTTATTTPTPASTGSTAKIITKPIRAGSQVYAKGGDLIILSGVNPGAECFADGHIHVYGPLRGKALAGIRGDESARIFCKSLDAELISIAGHYQQKDKISRITESTGMIQIYLENQTLKTETL